jgi:hypothetical protein
MATTNRIAVMTVLSPHSWIIINALVERFGPVDIIAEQRIGKLELIRRRGKHLGYVNVAGQIGFVILQKLLAMRHRKRIDEIVESEQLNIEADPACRIFPVSSVNSMACRAALAMINPEVVVVIGTRIIGRATLDAVKVPILNSHAGWNPKYRGQAGGYWALASGDTEHAGVTIHLVDQGVDTGAILYQERFVPRKDDSFHTYYYLQAGIARALAVKAVEDALTGALAPVASDLPSRQFYLPTLWNYIWTGLTRRVW